MRRSGPVDMHYDGTVGMRLLRASRWHTRYPRRIVWSYIVMAFGHVDTALRRCWHPRVAFPRFTLSSALLWQWKLCAPSTRRASPHCSRLSREGEASYFLQEAASNLSSRHTHAALDWSFNLRDPQNRLTYDLPPRPINHLSTMATQTPPSPPQAKPIAYIGLGNADYPLASTLHRAGYALVVRDADPSRTQKFSHEHTPTATATAGDPIRHQNLRGRGRAGDRATDRRGRTRRPARPGGPSETRVRGRQREFVVAVPHA